LPPTAYRLPPTAYRLPVTSHRPRAFLQGAVAAPVGVSRYPTGPGPPGPPAPGPDPTLFSRRLTTRKSVALHAAVEAVENVSQYLRVPRLVSIRSRILALAVVGTVLPAGIALGVAYSQNKRARQDKINQELISESSQAAGALGVWLKERVYDLRVFAGSDEVSNNLARVSAPAPRI